VDPDCGQTALVRMADARRQGAFITALVDGCWRPNPAVERAGICVDQLVPEPDHNVAERRVDGGRRRQNPNGDVMPGGPGRVPWSLLVVEGAPSARDWSRRKIDATAPSARRLSTPDRRALAARARHHGFAAAPSVIRRTTVAWASTLTCRRNAVASERRTFRVAANDAAPHGPASTPRSASA